MENNVNNSFLKLAISLNLFIVFLAPSGCKPANPFVFTAISSEIELNEVKKEFQFTMPFIPKKQVNKICFYLSEKFKDDTTLHPLRFPDGTPVIIEATLVDSQGVEYQLNEFGEKGEDILCYVPKDYSNWLEISKRNISFVKLIVRSNRQIKVLKIEWKSYNAWDIK